MDNSFTVTIAKNNPNSESDPKSIMWALVVLFIIGGTIFQACN